MSDYPDNHTFTTDALRDYIREAQSTRCLMPNCAKPWATLTRIRSAGPRTPSNLVGLCPDCNLNYLEGSAQVELMRDRKLTVLLDIAHREWQETGFPPEPDEKMGEMSDRKRVSPDSVASSTLGKGGGEIWDAWGDYPPGDLDLAKGNHGE